MRVSKGTGRFSAKLLQESILLYYVSSRLLPSGMLPEMDCIQVWSLKMGLALQRLAPGLFSSCGSWRGEQIS